MRRLLPIVLAFCCMTGVVLAKKEAPRKPTPAIHYEIGAEGFVRLAWTRASEPLYIERRLESEATFSVLDTAELRQSGWIDSTLAPGAVASYRLRPVDSRYYALFGPETVVAMKLPPPQPPQLKRVGVDAVEIRVEPWPAGADTVRIERRIDGIFTTIAALTPPQSAFTDSGLAAWRYHYYRIQTARGTRQSPPSARDSIGLDLPPLVALDARRINDHTAALSWRSTAVFPSAFEIEKRNADGVTCFLTAPGALQWSDTNLGVGRKAYYRVRARNGLDSSEYTSVVTVTSELLPASGLRLDSLLALSVYLGWTHDDSLAAAFVVERSADSLLFSPIARLDITVRTYADVLEHRGQTLYYRVVTVATDGQLAPSRVLAVRVPRLEEGMVFVPPDSNGSACYLDAAEITVAQYRTFVEATGRDLPSDPGFTGYADYWQRAEELPAVNVSWRDAIAFCNWRSRVIGLNAAYDSLGRSIDGSNGYRLMDRASFMRALHSVSRDSANLLGIEDGDQWPCAAQTAVASDQAWNLIGNVWEWAEDSVTTDTRLILGGGYTTPARLAGPVPEFCYSADYVSPTIGFRCRLISPGR